MNWMQYTSLAMSLAAIGLSLWTLHSLRRIRRANARLDQITRNGR